MKRIGQPNEIAHAILYVASAEASFVTGHILTVDGGKSAS
jgi:NAD(P)-dependent dehydrogenase (short-subunit alcohol dehydrogenase family)